MNKKKQSFITDKLKCTYLESGTRQTDRPTTRDKAKVIFKWDQNGAPPM